MMLCGAHTAPPLATAAAAVSSAAPVSAASCPRAASLLPRAHSGSEVIAAVTGVSECSLPHSSPVTAITSVPCAPAARELMAVVTGVSECSLSHSSPVMAISLAPCAPAARVSATACPVLLPARPPSLRLPAAPGSTVSLAVSALGLVLVAARLVGRLPRRTRVLSCLGFCVGVVFVAWLGGFGRCPCVPHVGGPLGALRVGPSSWARCLGFAPGAPTVRNDVGGCGAPPPSFLKSGPGGFRNRRSPLPLDGVRVGEASNPGPIPIGAIFLGRWARRVAPRRDNPVNPVLGEFPAQEEGAITPRTIPGGAVRSQRGRQSSQAQRAGAARAGEQAAAQGRRWPRHGQQAHRERD